MLTSQDEHYRMFDFEENTEAKKWITALRRAWLTEPPSQTVEIQKALQVVLHESWDLSTEQWATLFPTTRDVGDQHTHWRRQVVRNFYDFYKKVYERIRFDLPLIGDLEVGQDGIEYEGVCYRGRGSSEGPTSLTHDTLIVPAYLRPGTRLEVQIGSSVVPLVFDRYNPHEILWVRKDVEFSFRAYLPRDVVIDDDGLVALMVMSYIE